MSAFLKRVAFASVFCGLLFTVSAWEVPALTGRVVDQTSLLNASEKASIDRAIRTFEQATGGQFFVAILNPPDKLTIEEAGIKLMDAWKPGYKGKDNGAILLIVPLQRRMRLEIGYGWEGAVNDAKAGDIIRFMAKFFQRDRFAEGILAAIGRLAQDVTGEPLPDFPAEEPAVEEDVPGWLQFLIVVGVILLLFRYPWLMLFFFGCGRGGRGGGGSGFGGGGFSGGGGGRGGGGGASGGW